MFEKIQHESTYWWFQRLFSFLLIPLTIWLLIMGSALVASSDHMNISLLFNSFLWNYGSLILLIGIIVALHIRLGMEEVVDDYIHDSTSKLICSWCLRLLALRMIHDLYLWTSYTI